MLVELSAVVTGSVVDREAIAINDGSDMTNFFPRFIPDTAEVGGGGGGC